MAELVESALTAAGERLAGARILIMGYAYLEDSDDTRNSPSAALVQRLREKGAEAVIHDPYVPEFQGDLLHMAKGCQAAVVMVAHSVYRPLDLGLLKAALHTPVLIDGRCVFEANQATATGLAYRGIGLGTTRL
jgi:UDP-N-acetyl-D-mannosaminuronic acid dehydrogenase